MCPMVTAKKKTNKKNQIDRCSQTLSRMCLRKIRIAREWVVVVVVGVVGWGDLLPKVSDNNIRPT